MEYTKQRNEVHYQIDLWVALTELFKDRPEYSAQVEYRYKNCIFDIVIVKNHEVILIIETKKLPDGSFPNYKTPQIEKYSRFGIDVVICGHYKNIKKVARSVYLCVTCDRPGEQYYNETIYHKMLSQLKFMATTKKKKNVKAITKPGEGCTC